MSKPSQSKKSRWYNLMSRSAVSRNVGFIYHHNYVSLVIFTSFVLITYWIYYRIVCKSFESRSRKWKKNTRKPRSLRQSKNFKENSGREETFRIQLEYGNLNKDLLNGGWNYLPVQILNLESLCKDKFVYICTLGTEIVPKANRYLRTNILIRIRRYWFKPKIFPLFSK